MYFFKDLFKKRLEIPKNPGLILEKPRKTDAILEQIFGDADLVAGQASRDWRDDYPLHEIQANGDCVSFSRLNCAETKAKADGIVDEEGNEFNFADLDLAVGSGTTRDGNSMGRVSDHARKVGVTLEKYAPYTRDWNQRQAVIDRIPAIAKRYKLGDYAYVGGNGASAGNEIATGYLINALDRSPVQIAIGLGNTYNSGQSVISKPSYYSVYHAMELGFVDADGKKYLLDHYNRREVVIAPDYPILSAMAFVDLPANWRGLNVPGQTLHARLLGKLILRAESHGELYRVLPDKLVKVEFNITDRPLWEFLHATAREKRLFVGVSEKDFETLLGVVFGKVEEPKPLTAGEMLALINSL